MDIKEKLQTVLDAKKNIEDALIAKGADLTGKNITDYASIIENLPSGGASDFDSFEGIQQANSLSGLAEFASHCNCVGALLSHNNGTFTIWNGDSTAAGYWDPQATTVVAPATTYGTVIAVCAGKNKWVVKGAVDTYGNKRFANEGTDLFNYFLAGCVRGSGLDNTQHILTTYYNNHESNYEGTIWGWMKGVESNNSVLVNHLFIPNVEELREVALNTSDKNVTNDTPSASGSFQYSRNIGAFLELPINVFWSSSQYCEYRSYACCVSFVSGDVSSNLKGSDGSCLALLHFEEVI